MSAFPQWASRGLSTGVALGLPAPFGVALVAVVPDLAYGYPLLLLPLLAAGPLAARGLRPLPALLAALVAGVLSGVLAAVSLAAGSQVLGTSVWLLTP